MRPALSVSRLHCKGPACTQGRVNNGHSRDKAGNPIKPKSSRSSHLRAYAVTSRAVCQRHLPLVSDYFNHRTFDTDLVYHPATRGNTYKITIPDGVGEHKRGTWAAVAGRLQQQS
ncbi:hypothetical protein C7M84_022164 [Penaeus vannamei]|uniref:Uncharacterized protein n=1 Tax=Penaeus vannamei TaxID=6689 RepID=A0A3R7Q2Y0_PENVA|nr:hypothetical protein C7M84_022164 [Penaeus vannamei]